jgi:hypothetical protein
VGWVTAAEPDPDAAIREKLVGRWLYEQGDYRDVVAYHANGRMNATATVKKRFFAREDVISSGRWAVEKGCLVETFEASTSKGIPAGYVNTSRILDLSADTLVVEDGATGQKRAWSRIPPKTEGRAAPSVPDLSLPGGG